MFVGLCFVEGLATKRSIADKPPPELVTDLVYWLVAPSFRVLARILLAAGLVLVAALIGETEPAQLVSGFGPLARQPLPLMLLEALILSDFCSYWLHRLMHRSATLWRFHAVHHSATTIRWSTIGRNHPLNDILNYLAGLVPCLAVGLPLHAVLALVPFMTWWAVLAHSDFAWSFGPLRRLLVGPSFHRWHHTHSDEGGDKNFGNFLSVWDVLFGSYYLPEGRRPSCFGLDVDDMPRSYLGQLAYPFGLRRPASGAVREAREGARAQQAARVS